MSAWRAAISAATTGAPCPRPLPSPRPTATASAHTRVVPRALGSPAFVGRREELRRLAAALDHVKGAESRTVVVSNILAKLGVHSRVEAAALALREGFEDGSMR